MTVTLRQIAELAGVSRGTVDRVINNRGHVNEAVEARVRQIAEELGYEPNQAGRALARSKMNLKIGFLVQSAETPTMQILMQGVEEAAAKLKVQGVEVILWRLESLGEQKELDAIEALVKEGIKGLALTPSDSPEVCAALDRVVDSGIPVVTVNGDAPRSKRMCFVGMDNNRGGQTAAGLVHSMLPAGGKVLSLSAYPNNHGHRARYDSFAQELARIAPDITLLPMQYCFNRDDYAYELTLRALEENADLDVIYVTANGQQGVCDAIEKMRRAVRVVAYDLSPLNCIALEQGRIEFLIDQNAHVQGTLPPALLYDYLMSGKRPETPEVYTDILIKTRYNI